MPSPFDYLNTINSSKEDIMVTEDDEKEYAAFMVNRGLSQFADTVLLANEMNRYHHIPGKAQYQFLLNTVERKKRFSKWAKKVDSEAIALIQKTYQYSYSKAEAALSLLSESDIKILKDRNSKGGRKK